MPTDELRVKATNTDHLFHNATFQGLSVVHCTREDGSREHDAEAAWMLGLRAGSFIPREG